MNWLRHTYAYMRIRRYAFKAIEERSPLKLLELAGLSLDLAVRHQIYPRREITKDVYQITGKTNLDELLRYLSSLTADSEKAFPMFKPYMVQDWDRDKWGWERIDRYHSSADFILQRLQAEVERAILIIQESPLETSHIENRMRGSVSDLRYLIIWLAER